ncbi:MAG: acyl-CoA dehydrogenase family protein [Alphaproteobacteria bacterium]|jgi:acyl-CoA dehydrogenase|nr:acyl-CoA dehydrogenase [Rhodospirillaceae bacterium]MDP6405388.1 acyl-CoA dehydrogenase family protein [Alphaproteobacteria bacterium]MDP6620722.1 acyl-CoA dehydrogenase family protein [Alphaproteobacteria bacterium]|tara:strand:+ start:1990 stop:3153 length:1164 start_codon:yes stop_codon:yes gene_type:complete
MSAIQSHDPEFLTDEHRMLRDQVRRFVENEVVPAGTAWEEAGKVPREVFVKMGDLGLLGMRHAEEHGGGGLGTLSSIVLSEELGRSTFGGFCADVTVHTDCSATHISRRGTEKQKQKYLPDMCAGTKVCAVAVTEPGGGSDVAGLRTKAVRDGDEWVLNGSKMFITNGVYGDVIIVAARTDPDAKGSRGISLFIVEAGTPGLVVSRKLDKTGWLCSDTAELAFDDCRIPAENLLGEENRGFYAIMDNFQNERLVMGATCAGQSAKALEMTLDWVKQRQAFGGTLWDQQVVRHKLSLLAAELEALRQLIYHAAWLDEQGIDCVKETSMVKVLSGELNNRVMYDCVQLHGGMGYMRESPIERMSRDARIMSIGGGATEVMVEEIAKRLG